MSGPECGDGVVDGDEECDGAELDGQSCSSFGFDGGELTCAADCTFDDSECALVEVFCGDDVAEGDEACDGTDLRGQSCLDFDGDGGDLGCSDMCTVDTSACTSAGPMCGNGIEEGDEECDDGGRADEDGCDRECVEEFCGDGIVQLGLGEACDSGSTLVLTCDDIPGRPVGLQRCTSECELETVVCPNPALCGDGALDVGEACDDGNLESFDGCSSDCRSETCGNGALDELEACDGELLGDFACDDFGFLGGEVACGGCAVDISGCSNPVCGDGVLATGGASPEECDDGNREGGDGCDRRCRLEGTYVDVTFEETFTATDALDTDQTTATIETTETGFAVSPAPFVMGSPGDGGDGDYAPEASAGLTPGEYQFSSVTLDGVAINVAGDLTLRVTGDFRMLNESRLTVRGAFTLVIEGEVAITCSIVETHGDLVIEQTSDAGITQQCVERVDVIGEASVRTARDRPTIGNVRVWTRGSLNMLDNAYLHPGVNRTDGVGGDLEVRTAGDFIMRQDAYLIGGDNGTVDNHLYVFVEGDFRVEIDSYVIQESEAVDEDTGLIIRVGGDMHVTQDSYVIAQIGAYADVIVEGTLALTDYSYIDVNGSTAEPSRLDISAGNLFVAGGYASVNGRSAALGGPLTLRVAGDAHMGANADGATSGLWSGHQGCGDLGDMLIEVGGSFQALAGRLDVEPVYDAAGACPDEPRGTLTIRAGEAIVIDYDNVSQNLGGEPILEPGADLDIVVDAGLRTWVQVTSGSLPIEAEGALLQSADVVGPGTWRAVLQSGDDAIGFDEIAGQSLTDGWSYVLEIAARMFDDGSVDTVTVDYAVPE